MSGRLSDSQRFVNALRAALRKEPLYFEAKEDGKRLDHQPCGSYVSRTEYRRLAKPNCSTCGGAGYFDGWDLDMVCPCTGLPPRNKRGTGRRKKVNHAATA